MAKCILIQHYILELIRISPSAFLPPIRPNERLLGLSFVPSLRYEERASALLFLHSLTPFLPRSVEKVEVLLPQNGRSDRSGGVRERASACVRRVYPFLARSVIRKRKETDGQELIEEERRRITR